MDRIIVGLSKFGECHSQSKEVPNSIRQTEVEGVAGELFGFSTEIVGGNERPPGLLKVVAHEMNIGELTRPIALLFSLLVHGQN